MATFEPVLLRRAGRPLDIGAYRADGGYRTLERALNELQPQQITEKVVASGLRGRGGRTTVCQAVPPSSLDQAQLFNGARHRGLGYVDTARSQLASQLGLGRGPPARQDFQYLSATVDLVHAILCSQFINTPLRGF